MILQATGITMVWKPTPLISSQNSRSFVISHITSMNCWTSTLSMRESTKPIKITIKIFSQPSKKVWQLQLSQCKSYISHRFSIYQMARRGKVLPFLSQYGRIFKTHRLFRHYVYALVLPTTLFCSLVDMQHIDNVEKLWSIHARRMQRKYAFSYDQSS